MIDYLNRDYVISNLVARDERILSGCCVRNERCLTDDCRRVEKTTTIITEGAERRFRESVRLYSAVEIMDMLRDVVCPRDVVYPHGAGFVDVRSYGSLDGQEFGPGSTRLIVVAEKEGANGD